MAFVAAISAASKRKIGVNGANCYTEDGVGDPRVALYTSMVRGLGAAEIGQSIEKVFAAGLGSTDLWLLAFQARDVRGGKGERDLFHTMFGALSLKRRAEALALLPLVPEYGSWLDVVKIFEQVPGLSSAALDLIVKQFRADRAALAAGATAKISLLAKWLPRYGAKTFAKTTPRRIAEALFPTIRRADTLGRLYRIQCSELNAALKTVEVPMCGGAWASIQPGHVPGRAMTLYRKAFLNEKKNGQQRSIKDDRVKCAANFKAHLEQVLVGKATVKGSGTVFPHEITRRITGASGDEEALLNAQWSAIRDGVTGKPGVAKCVPMCDFSGSMEGLPMDIAAALGILLSEVNHPAFRDYVLTFDAKPQWLHFPAAATLKEKVAITKRSPWGMNTNFEAALQLILDRMVEHKVPVGEEPENLVVFTDMGFDAATTVAPGAGWETLLETFQRRFKAAGGWSLPRIVVWNLRAAYKDYHATADQEGVLMLSGWSPSCMKVITEGVQVQTPYEGMRALLDAARYDAVREVLGGAATAAA